MKVLAIAFASSLALVLILHRKRKIANPDKQLDQLSKFDKMRWRQVGNVQNLIIYPLMYGTGIGVPKCNIKLNGICVTHIGGNHRDNALAVYEEKTKHIYSRTFILAGIKIIITNETCMKLEAANMSNLTLNRNKANNNEVFVCLIWNTNKVCATVKCTDCGAQAAEWISMCVNGKKSGLRLGYVVEAPSKAKTLWEDSHLNKLCTRKKKSHSNLNPFLDPLYYKITSSQSLIEIGNITRTRIMGLWTQIHPNIIISAAPFAKDDWQWMKMGNAIFKCIKPFSKPPTVSNDLTSLSMGMRLKLMTMNYQLCVPGITTVGDVVYVNLDNVE